LEILNMGLYDKTNWKRWSVRIFLNLGFTLCEQHEIIRGQHLTMDLSPGLCVYFCNSVNNSISFENKGGKITRSANN